MERQQKAELLFKEEVFKEAKYGLLKNTGSSNTSNSSRDTTPLCTICSNRHRGICYRVSGACFNCGKQGHMAKDCKHNSEKFAASSTASVPKPRNATRSTPAGDAVRQGRVFALVPGNTRNANAVVLGTISI